MPTSVVRRNNAVPALFGFLCMWQSDQKFNPFANGNEHAAKTFARLVDKAELKELVQALKCDRCGGGCLGSHLMNSLGAHLEQLMRICRLRQNITELRRGPIPELCVGPLVNAEARRIGSVYTPRAD